MLPDNFENGTVVLSLNTGGIDTGRYSVRNLTLNLTRHVTADIVVPAVETASGYPLFTVTIPQATGIVGEQLTYTLTSPSALRNGGWADLPDAKAVTIVATVNADGTITTDDVIGYHAPDATGDTGGKDNDHPTTGGNTGTPAVSYTHLTLPTICSV